MKVTGKVYATVILGIACCAMFTPRLYGCVTFDTDVLSYRCGESDCQFHCALAAPATKSDKYVPGFEAVYRSEALIVSSVFPGSPAERAGLRIGDKLISFDGSKYPVLDPADNWQQPRSHLVAVLRDGQELRISITAITMAELLSRMPRLAGTVPTALSGSVRSIKPLRPLPFMSGMNVEKRGARIIVSEVIAGAPADIAGIKPGDEILLQSSRPLTFTDFTGSDTPGVMGLFLISHGVKRNVRVRLVPLSDLWLSHPKNISHRQLSVVSTS